MKQITWDLMFNLLIFFSQALSSATLRHILLFLANNGTFCITIFYRNKVSDLQSMFLNNSISQKTFSLYIWFQNLVGGKQLIHQTQLENPCPFYMFNFERIKCVSEISDDFFISAIKRTPKLWLYTYNVQLVVLQ